ncbi:hypothetical protein D3C83_275160 [compost metagenome]
MAVGVSSQLDVFVSNSPSSCSRRYCSSSSSAAPIAVAIPTALPLGLSFFLEASASGS